MNFARRLLGNQQRKKKKKSIFWLTRERGRGDPCPKEAQETAAAWPGVAGRCWNIFTHRSPDKQHPAKRPDSRELGRVEGKVSHSSS